MRDRPRRLSIQVVLFLGFTLVAVLAIGFLSVQRWSWTTGQLERDARAEDLALARAVTSGLEHYMRQRQHYVQTVARELTPRDLAGPAALGAFLTTARARDVALASLGVVDRAGVAVAFAPPVDDHGRPTAGRNLADRLWFQHAVSRRDPTYDVVVGRVSLRPTIAVAAPIVAADGAIAGVLVAGLDLDVMRGVNREIDRTGADRLVVVDGRGRVIVHVSRAWEEQARDLSREAVFQAAREQREGSLDYASPFDGTARAAAFVRMPSTGWVVWASRGPTERQARLQSLLRAVGVSGLLALLLAAGAALVVTRAVSAPLRTLATATRRVAAGRLQEPDLLAARDARSRIREFDDLLTGFGHMTEALRGRYEDLERKVTERTAALTQAVQEAREAAERLTRQQEIQGGYGELAALLNSLDRSFILDQGTRKVAATLHAPVAAVFLTENGPGSLRLKTYAALDAAAVDAALLSPAGLPAEVARRREPVVVAAASERTPLRLRAGLGELDVAVVAGFPLVHQTRLMGVLAVALLTPLTEDTRGFLVDAARQLSVAISNAALFESIRYHAQELDQLNAALVQASEAKSRFLSSMSHELRTPLNAILGFTELLLMSERERVTERQRGALEKVRDSGRHLLALINQVLDLARIEAGRDEVHAEPLALGPLVIECLETVEPQATQQRLALRAVGLAEAPEIVQDRQKLKQILLNLLANAVKFTRAGSVEIRVAAEPGEQVSLAVADTGIGIRPEDQRRLFQEFVRLGPGEGEPASGSGLGLVIARHLAELLGGTLTLSSQIGQGSVFTLRLPRRYTASTPTAWPDPPDGPPAPGTGRLLVIDDDRDAVEIVREALEAEPVTVDWAPDAVTGRERVRTLQPTLIMLDVMLQGTADGWDILAELKADAQTRAIPVILHSVIDNPERARRLGADEVLVKPTPLGAIRALVRRMLDRERTAV